VRPHPANMRRLHLFFAGHVWFSPIGSARLIAQ